MASEEMPVEGPATNGATTDLGSFDGFQKAQEEGYPLRILNPMTGQEFGATIWVAGPDSARARKAANRAINDAMRAQRVKRTTAEESYSRSLTQLADLVCGWEGIVLRGETLAPTPENVMRVFREFPWIANQVDIAAADRSLFTPA